MCGAGWGSGGRHRWFGPAGPGRRRVFFSLVGPPPADGTDFACHRLSQREAVLALPEPALAPAQFLKHTVPGAALCVFPRTGHAVNAEEPALFNHVLVEFLNAVDAGRWGA